MAELEEGRRATKAARANGWRARSTRARDPAWTADGFVSERWLPVSPVTGRLDAFEWKDPLAGEDHAGALIEHRAERAGGVAAPAVLSAKDADAKQSATARSAAGEGPPSAELAQPAPLRCERGEGESAASGRGGRSPRPFLRWWAKRAPRNGGGDGG